MTTQIFNSHYPSCVLTLRHKSGITFSAPLEEYCFISPTKAKIRFRTVVYMLNNINDLPVSPEDKAWLTHHRDRLLAEMTATKLGAQA